MRDRGRGAAARAALRPRRRRRDRHHQPARDHGRLGPRRRASRCATPSSGRTAAPRGFCDRLRAEGVEATIRERTGLVLDAYFSGTKIALDPRQRAGRAGPGRGRGARLRHRRHLAAWKLTGGRLHVTDASNASRTLLFDITTGELGRRAAARSSACPARMLPEVRASSEVYGEVRRASGARRGAASRASPATSRRRSSASCCTAPGLTKNTYGTGCFMLQNTGDEAGRLTPPAAHHGGLEARRHGCSTRSKAASSSAAPSCSGCATAWGSSGLERGRARSPPRCRTAAASSWCRPSPGSGAPHWDPYARGALVGITRGTTAGHIARAALEAIAFQVADLLDAMRADAGIAADRELRVDGGASRNELLMQFQADLLGVPVVRPARHRDDGPRRRLPGRAGRGLLEGRPVHRRPWQGRARASSRRCRPRAPKASARVGAARRRARQGLGASPVAADESRRDAEPRPGPERALGPDRRRRRRHRRGRGGRCRRARLRGAAPRAERLRQGHVQPQHQARARRRPLPRAGQHLAGDGGAAGSAACSARTRRTSCATSPSWCRATSGGRRRSTASASRSTTCSPASTASAPREILSREETLAAPAHHPDRGPARRRRLLRRPVRRRAAAHQPGRAPPPSRARRC